jgi:hypothetical protein
MSYVSPAHTRGEHDGCLARSVACARFGTLGQSEPDPSQIAAPDCLEEVVFALDAHDGQTSH